MSGDFRELALLLMLVALVVVPAAGLRIRRLRAPLRRLRSAGGGRRRTVDLGAMRSHVARVAASDPRRLIALGTIGAAGSGLLTGGPVAAIVAAVYALLLVRALLRATARRAAAAARSSSLDELCSLAGGLRAGLPPAACRAAGKLADRRLAELTAAVWRLAERTGAPAADLVERIEDDARTADRATASARAQAAGAQMTALLLAALPLAGIGLGYSIGADPVQVLFGTKLGAACALGAVTLQAGGLLWCDRMNAGVTR